MAKHLAVFLPGHIEAILAGEKLLEGRFSLKNIPPYGVVAKGDEIFLKERSKEVVGKVICDNVLYYENLGPEELGRIRHEFGKDLGLDEKFWQAKASARFATIIFWGRAWRFVTPLPWPRQDRRPWVVSES